MSILRTLLRHAFQSRYFSIAEFKRAQNKADKGRDEKQKDGKKQSPKMKTFKIYSCRPMVLDALMKIKMEQDSTLAFRKSCREGICGSCGVNIDGINRLACLHKIRPRGTTKIYPLPHMYVIKDLIVDMNKFLAQHNRIKPYPIPKELCVKSEGDQQFLQSIKDREKMRLEPGRAISQLRLYLSKFKKKPKPDMVGKAPSDPYKACPKDECE
ncbi:unnamed protein product [Acanthoscelides obtectus]|uniref:Succinate dehydrogenase [ubiquinone] iron-sulfur subunit, mitochondrial n=1 Tax=Acanthoscelides obtectus TaxID=200917 RepID=A0A9P0JX46_ACAOB|nr:unnamed protein product [Acanthoscelides obtectus]CAK1653065.1 Succinate dehydrogenase [ubiquinone] iron-sulfur subunit, mitochondrial [Acanthoscelides obtectus]